jgi:hypothetical protein
MSGPCPRRALISCGIVILGFTAISVGAWPSRGEKTQRQIRQVLLAELRPVSLTNCTLKRFGSTYDGGYLMCENLIDGLGAAYSYGIGPNDEWGCDVSTRYRLRVHQYDCFDPTRPVCETGNTVFHDECIGNRREYVDSLLFDTLAHQISRNGDSGKRLVVKIDVEGAEWDALMATSDATLERIDQLSMELHGSHDRRFLRVIQKLKRTFYVVNLHFNNYSCSTETAPFPSRAYQVLMVNKRIGVLDVAARTPSASALNAPDNPQMPDCQLNFDVR